MKKKNLKKILKTIRREIGENNLESNYYVLGKKNKKSRRHSNEFCCSFDSEVSEKFHKFILAIFKFRDTLNFELNEERIGISGDLSKMNPKNNINSCNEDYLDIEITKQGFTFRRNYGAFISFNDESIFDKLIITLREKNEIFSKTHLIESIDDISILTNVVRELNLDNLINEFEKENQI